MKLDLTKNFDGHHAEVTYFVKAGDFVKIGKTTCIKARIIGLKTGSPEPIELLKLTTLPEKEAHCIAARITERQIGEWFNTSDELIEWMSGLPDASPLSPRITPEENSKAESFVSGMKAFVVGRITIEQAGRRKVFSSMLGLMEGLISRGVSESDSWECVKSAFENCFRQPAPTLPIPALTQDEQ